MGRFCRVRVRWRMGGECHLKVARPYVVYILFKHTSTHAAPSSAVLAHAIGEGEIELW